MGCSVINKNKSIIIITIVLFVLLFCGVNLSFAANLGDAFGSFLTDTAETGAGYTATSWENIIQVIIQTALTFLGVVFLILMIYGGYLWMTARGNDEQSEKAKKTITAAIIGIVMVLSAYAISYLVIEKLGDKALDSSSSAGESSSEAIE